MRAMSEEKTPEEIADLQSEPLEPASADVPPGDGPSAAPPAALSADAPEPSDDAPESPRAAPGYPAAFRHLSRRGKVLRVVVIVALVIHLGAMFLGGAITPVRKFFSPVIGFYAEGLRMSNAWGMFGKPPGSTNVSIEAVRKDGTKLQLSTTDAARRTLWERVRDVRIRKIIGKLADEGDRARLGPPFMDYFCKEAKARFGDVREVRAINDIHETRDDSGAVTRAASTQVIVTRPCMAVAGQPPRKDPPAFRKRPRPDEANPGGGDL
jgi:hypothetical protein